MPRWGGQLPKSQSESLLKTRDKIGTKTRDNDNDTNINDMNNRDNDTSVNINENKANNILLSPESLTLKKIKMFTPLSKEAMKRCGVIPNELVYKTLNNYINNLSDDIPKEVGELRYKFFETKRKQLIKNIVNERKNLININWKPIPNVNDVIQKAKLDLKKNKQKKDNKTLKHSQSSINILDENPIFVVLNNDEIFLNKINKEEQQFNKELQHQKIELEKMIAKEVALMLKKKKLYDQIADQKKKEEQLKDEYNKKMEKIRLKKYNDELNLLIKEEYEHKQQQILAQKEYELRMKQKKDYDIKMRKEKKLHEMEIKLKEKKKQDWLDSVRYKQNQIKLKNEMKLKKMLLKDKLRQKKLFQKRQKESMLKREKMRIKQEKVSKAMKNIQRIERLKKEKIMEKELNDEKRVKQFMKDKNLKLNNFKKKMKEIEIKRQRAQELVDNKIKKRAQDVYNRELKIKKNKQEKLKKERVKMMLNKERDILMKLDKDLNVKRNTRIKEYKSELTNKKNEYEMTRLKAIELFKESIKDKKRIQNELTKTQKQKIIKQFSNIVKSDKFDDTKAAVKSMLNLAQNHLGTVESLKLRLKNHMNINIDSLKLDQE